MIMDGRVNPFLRQKPQDDDDDKTSAGEDSPLDDKFAAFVDKALRRWHVPGVAVAVVDGDDTWAEGYGLANRERSSLVTSSTLFYAGSTTKAFTAAIISQLIDDSASASPEDVYLNSPPSPLTWRTPISSLIAADFVTRDSEWATHHLTLEDALSHRTGFPRHDKALAQSYGADSHPATVRDYARSIRYLPMVTEPRVRWRYCNYMFMVMSHIVQTITGQWLGDVMRERIWEPLGMNSTFFKLEDALDASEELAQGYYWDYVGEMESGEAAGAEFVKVPFNDHQDGASGAGGIISNVLDFSRWIRCMLCLEEPISYEGHRELKTPRISMGPENTDGYDSPPSYGLGWILGTYRGVRVVSHSGDMEAHGSEVFFLPDLDYGVVVMGNSAGSTSNFAGREVAWKLINDKLGVRVEERFDWGAKGEQRLRSQLRAPETAVEDLYPDRADPPLPRSLPLDSYAGTYFHPAYRSMTIEVAQDYDDNGDEIPADRELVAVRDDMHWQMTYEFEHASGEYWAVIIDMLNTPNRLSGQRAKAQFRIGVSGKVEGLEIEFLQDGSEGVIVFEKVD